jgi:hypothetical protein
MDTTKTTPDRKKKFVILGFILILLVVGYKSLLPIAVSKMGTETDARAIKKYQQERRRGHDYFLQYEFTVDGSKLIGVSQISSDVFHYKFEDATWRKVSWDKDAVSATEGVDMKRMKESYRVGESEPLKVRYLPSMPQLNTLSSPAPETDYTYLYITGIVFVLMISYLIRFRSA